MLLSVALHTAEGAPVLIDDQQVDIARRLSRRSDGHRAAKLVSCCTTGACTACGDVCPVKTDRWRRRNGPAIEKLFSAGKSDVILEVRLTSDRWSRKPDELGQVGIGAIEKAIRRSFDRLRQPATIAVGMIDAWYGWRQWDVGANFLIVGPRKSEIFEAFPVGVALQIDSIRDVGKAAKALFAAGQCAKYLPAFDAINPEPGTRRRGEYYAWLAACPPGSRVFRYGCDRYFNSLKKPKRLPPLHPKKGHPYPHWLRECMFGNHAWNCQCKACQGG
jgi:hypothetical protein